MKEEMPRTDELQPLSDVQAQQVREFVEKLQKKRAKGWDVIPEGFEVTWDVPITPERVILYADGVEDYNSWYEAWPIGPGESPFGAAIAPPAMLSKECNNILAQMLAKKGYPGGATGLVHTFHDSQILAPCPVGTIARFHAKMIKKFIKRGRQYFQGEITIEDANTGKTLFKETREMLFQYQKVSE